MDRYSPSFKLILYAGNSKNKSIKSLDYSKQRKFEEASALIEEAKEELILAHEEQSSLMVKEATGKKVDMNMLLVHAQDHICVAEIYLSLAEEVLELRREFCDFRRELNE